MNDNPEQVSAEDRSESIETSLLGYLNFSNGTPDSKFRANFNQLEVDWGTPAAFTEIQFRLGGTLERLSQESAAFKESVQAEAVIDLVFDHVWPAYREFHKDLLFHVDEGEFAKPYFAAILCEAVLAQAGPWDELDRIIEGSIDFLNDFIGHRPVGLLENGREMQPYLHERYRPIPYYFSEVGTSQGIYKEIIDQTFELFRQAPEEFLESANFNLKHVHELAIDVRAYDHLHPVYRRTNYLFGEWDPHIIGMDGRYHRFILRKIILDALVEWIEQQSQHVPYEEALFDASAALCGTILMASSISGSGPDTHDSTVSLTTLLPSVARLRDQFYNWLLSNTDGPRQDRLNEHFNATRQPFGHVRQHLNLFLSKSGAGQVRHRELSILFARMGFPEESRKHAEKIPAASLRFESEIRMRIRTAQLHLENNEIEEAHELYKEIENLIHRGIECGAFVDPWNILAFQGMFPLFQTREDSLPDSRVDVLINIMEQTFVLASRILCESAAAGQKKIVDSLSENLSILSEWWDKHSTNIVEEVASVKGSDYYESAIDVAEILAAWKSAGENTADMMFWKNNIDRLDTAISFSQVIESLLDKGDDVASMGLLMQWLSRSDEFGLDASSGSLHDLLLRWMSLVVDKMKEQPDLESSMKVMQRLFDFLEANAGSLWHSPQLGPDGTPVEPASPPLELNEEDLLPDDAELADDDSSNDFSAAYDGMSFQDSADDGNQGAVFDPGGHSIFDTTEIERLQRRLEKHLRFLHTMAQLWQFSADFLMRQGAEQDTQLKDEQLEVVASWYSRVQALQMELMELLTQIKSYSIDEPSGDHDANVEFDIQRQVKYQLLTMVISTQVACISAEWALAGCLPDQETNDPKSTFGLEIVPMYQAVLYQDSERVRKLLPEFLDKIRKLPLLYIPFEHGGEVKQVLAAQSLQALLRLLIEKLPELGMHRESWHVLQSAYFMERTYRPHGPSVTEFDRLFRIGLRSSLRNINRSSTEWQDGQFPKEDLVNTASEVIDHYMELWHQHSNTMRLSAVEPLFDEVLWSDVQEFVETYGSSLFHAQILTLGNVRTILQMGIGNYLEYLTKNSDPLKTPKLIDDLESKAIEVDNIEFQLELVYQIIIDKYDRFLEYNTTTTQSDYGEKFSCFLDFLRVEAEYERDEWNYLPFKIAHESFVNESQMEAAQIYEDLFTRRSNEKAEEHLSQLAKQQQKHGVKLPGITDHLQERFVKPLAVNRMLALVKLAMNDVQSNLEISSSFERLCSEIEVYQNDLHGSSIEIPEWLRLLDIEVTKNESTTSKLRVDSLDSGLVSLPQKSVPLAELQRQLNIWDETILAKNKKSDSEE